MTNTLTSSPVLDRERRKRIQRREQVLEFSTNVNRAVKILDRKIDESREIIKRNEEAIFGTPYKDWRVDQ